MGPSDQSLFEQRIFTEARSFNAWTEEPVSDATLQRLYELMKWGPTSSNSCPLRIVFARSLEAKSQLAAAAAERNSPKILEAPVTAILAYDLHFSDRLPELFPHNPAITAMYRANERLVADTAFRNSSIQGGYFIVAARMIGLDCGPMSGFDHQVVDRDFFPDGRWRSNFLCLLGHGDRTRDFWPRLARPSFESACVLT